MTSLKLATLTVLFIISAWGQKSVELGSKASDAFMADVTARKTEAAVRRWHKKSEDQFERGYIDKLAKSSIERIISTCGQPSGTTALNSAKPEHATLETTEQGTIPQLIFLYRSRTPIGIRQFEVTVQADKTGEYHVAGFGCGKPPSERIKTH